MLMLAQAALAQPPRLTNADIIKLANAGISDGVVVSMIQSAPVAAFDVSADEVVALKTAGVSNEVVGAMVAKAAGATSAVVPTSPDAPLLDKIAVPDGTVFRLRLNTPLSSGTARRDDPVRLEVSIDVAIRGVVVIAKGAEAIGRVGEASKSKSFGRAGKLTINLTSVQAIDGSSIPIRSERELKGEARVGATVAAVALVGVFGGFVKGKNIDLPVGSEFDVFTSGERAIVPKRQ